MYLNYIKYISTVYLTFCKINLTKKKKNSHDQFVICVCILWSLCCRVFLVHAVQNNEHVMNQYKIRTVQVMDKVERLQMFLHGGLCHLVLEKYSGILFNSVI